MGEIFVSIACYRDPEVVPTVRNAYERASNRRRIIFGIYAQMGEDDVKLNFDFIKNQNQVRLLVKPHNRARGPAYARYIIYNKLYRNELYYLQIDSHTRFVDNWDEELISMLGKLKANSVISSYPRGYKLGKESLPQSDRVNVLKLKKIRSGVPVLSSYVDRLDKPQRNYYWAAGYSFCYGAIFKIVPFDKHLKNIFWGEEFLMSLRFYTHNIRIYTPHKNIVFTLWSRNYRHTFWELKEEMKGKFEVYGLVSFLRLCHIGRLCEDVLKRYDIGKVAEDLDKYGLGCKKNCEEYYEKTGIQELLKEEEYERLIKKIYFSLKLN